MYETIQLQYSNESRTTSRCLSYINLKILQLHIVLFGSTVWSVPFLFDWKKTLRVICQAEIAFYAVNNFENKQIWRQKKNNQKSNDYENLQRTQLTVCGVCGSDNFFFLCWCFEIKGKYKVISIISFESNNIYWKLPKILWFYKMSSRVYASLHCTTHWVNLILCWKLEKTLLIVVYSVWEACKESVCVSVICVLLCVWVWFSTKGL